MSVGVARGPDTRAAREGRTGGPGPLGGAEVLAILKAEIQPATGCTEIGAAALAAARAREVLGTCPHGLELRVSANVFKNGVAAGIPGTTLKGLAHAVALGALIGDSDKGLEVLDGVDADKAAEAERWVAAGRVAVVLDVDAPDPVFLQAEAGDGDHRARATILQRHSRIAEVLRDGRPVGPAPHPEVGGPATDDGLLERLAAVRVGDLVDTVLALDVAALGFLLEAARTNGDGARADLGDASSTLGPALQRLDAAAPSPGGTAGAVQVMTAAASEARMRGLPVPIIALSGSGNHGITAFLGVAAFAGQSGADAEATARALALAAILAVYVKARTGRLTSYCGCAIAPATGVAAAAVYLLGGDTATMVAAMRSVIGTFAGMLCDGAKLSCAYKVSTVAASAVQFAHLAMDGASVPAGDGIVGSTIEETIGNLGVLNNPGMRETDRVVVELLRRAH